MTKEEMMLDQISLVHHLSATCRNIANSDTTNFVRKQEMNALGVFLEMHGEKLEEIYDAMGGGK